MSSYALAGKKRYRSSRSRRYKGRRRYRRTGSRLASIGWPRYKRGPYSRYYRKSISGPGNLAAELKYWDTAATRTALYPGSVAGGAGLFANGWAGGYLGCFNAVAVGDSYNSRDGNQIRMKYLHVKGQINWEPPAGNAPTNGPPLIAGAFLALVLDKQTNTVACPSEQIFANPCNAASGQEGNSMIQVNSLARRRFKVLKEQRFIVSNRNFMGITGNPMTGTFGNTTAQFEWLIPLNSLPVEFVGETGTITTIQKNSLNLYGWGYDSTVSSVGTTMGSNGSVRLSFNARLRFYG